MPEQGGSPAALDRLRRELPGRAAAAVTVIADNPVQFGVLIAADIVACQLAVNLVRPRTPLQALALMVVLVAGLPAAAEQAIVRGWIPLRVRDKNGNLVPLNA